MYNVRTILLSIQSLLGGVRPESPPALRRSLRRACTQVLTPPPPSLPAQTPTLTRRSTATPRRSGTTWPSTRRLCSSTRPPTAPSAAPVERGFRGPRERTRLGLRFCQRGAARGRRGVSPRRRAARTQVAPSCCAEGRVVGAAARLRWTFGGMGGVGGIAAGCYAGRACVVCVCVCVVWMACVCGYEMMRTGARCGDSSRALSGASVRCR